MKTHRIKNRVLLAAPDGPVKKLMAEILQTKSFHVLLAETGQKALRTVRDHLIDVVVLEDRTPLTRAHPVTHNVRTLKAITDASPFLPVVLVCGGIPNLDHATSLMADMILIGRVEPLPLVDAVDTVLEETLRERAQRKAAGLALVG